MGIALNKSSLKNERDELKQFRKYLPSLDLKRQQLVGLAKGERAIFTELETESKESKGALEEVLPLLGSTTLGEQDLSVLVRIEAVNVEEENVLGVKMPVAREVKFQTAPYSRLVTPFWLDFLVESLQKMAVLRVRMQVQKQRVERLEAAVRRTTQRVNLFDKVLIPNAQKNIKKITIFLSDQERAAVVNSKIAKNKQARTAKSQETAG